jgi:hypothetical protein
MKANVEKVKSIIAAAIPNIPKVRRCECKTALQNALV